MHGGTEDKTHLANCNVGVKKVICRCIVHSRQGTAVCVVYKSLSLNVRDFQIPCTVVRD